MIIDELLRVKFGLLRDYKRL